MKLSSMHFLGEYVYLGDQTRRTFASLSHFFLIEQSQMYQGSIQSGLKGKSRFDLSFNHMVKALWWVGRAASRTEGDNCDFFDFSGFETGAEWGTRENDLFATAELTLNNNDRVGELDPLYFRLVQPHISYIENVPDEFIYMYSFSLQPQKHGPSGAVNMSRIERVELHLNLSVAPTENMDIFVFALNYNVVSIKSGVSSLLFSS